MNGYVFHVNQDIYKYTRPGDKKEMIDAGGKRNHLEIDWSVLHMHNPKTII